MILGFKPQFKQPILEGSKIHTIREDKPNRWKAGNKIHFATGVRTKNYNQFKDGECKSVQEIQIKWFNYPSSDISYQGRFVKVFIDNKIITNRKVYELALNDGFKDSADFFKWFNKDITGKIIHWTELKY